MATVSISGPATRLRPRRSELAERVRQAGLRISQAMGYGRFTAGSVPPGGREKGGTVGSGLSGNGGSDLPQIVLCGRGGLGMQLGGQIIALASLAGQGDLEGAWGR
ncbi:MAG: hypothetical protein ACPLRW_13445 [Moorellales bacterium]